MTTPDVNRTKISDLTENNTVRENHIIPINSTATDGSETTERTTVSDLRKALNFDNAFATLQLALTKTVHGEEFFVYEDNASKEWVLGWRNQYGSAVAVNSADGIQLRYPTNLVLNSLPEEQVKLMSNVRESWRRQLASIGITLAAGSFEEGAVVTNTSTAVWCIDSGQCYTWQDSGLLPKTIAAGSTPETTGGIKENAWVSVAQTSVITVLNAPGGSGVSGYSKEFAYPLNTVGAELSKTAKTINYLNDITLTTPREMANNERFIGVGGNITTITAPPGAAAFKAVGAEDVILDGLKIIGDGKAGTPGTTGIYFDGNLSSKQPLRNEFKNLRVQDLAGNGLRLSAGWNNVIKNSRFSNIGKSGISIEESPILNGWGGSGHLFESIYLANCVEYGMSNVTGWANTYINMVMEYNGAGFRERGDNSVYINPWLESNTNAPLIERGCVFLGGRGLTFRPTLGSDLITANESVTWLDKRGIKVFRDPSVPYLDVDGNGFKAARSVSGLEIGGARTATTSSRVPLVQLKGYSDNNPANAASFDKLVSEIQLNAAFDTAQNGSSYGRIVLRSGISSPNGTSTNPVADRWELRFDGTWHPSTDNTYSVGRSGQRVSEVFAGAAAINTSDERYKTRADASDELRKKEKLIATEIKESIYRFQFNDAIDSKGVHARYHFGVGAQTVAAIFERHGLTASDYSFWCHDQWEAQIESWDDEYSTEISSFVDKNGMPIEKKTLVRKAGSKVIREAGEIYGIRYEELAMFILSAM